MVVGADDRSNAAAGAGEPPASSPDDEGFDPRIAAVLDAARATDGPEPTSMDAPRSYGPPIESGPRAASEDEPPPHVRLTGDPEADDSPVTPQADFQTIMREAALEAVRIHAEETADREVCGVLVGSVFENPSSALVYIEAAIRGEGAGNRGATVTFTAETWRHIEQVMDEKYPDKRIVGWYHSHPGFGIFLSEMDLFIQKNFFNAPWQTAFVYDPRSGEKGMFAWRGGQTRRVDFALDDGAGDEPIPALGGGFLPAATAATLASRTNIQAAPVEESVTTSPQAVVELSARVQSLEQRLRWTLVGAALLALVAIAWPLVAMLVVVPSNVPTTPPSTTPAVTPPGGTISPPFRPDPIPLPAIPPPLPAPPRWEFPSTAPTHGGAKGSVDVPLAPVGPTTTPQTTPMPPPPTTLPRPSTQRSPTVGGTR